MKSLIHIVSQAKSEENEINRLCVDYFVDCLQQGELDDIDIVKDCIYPSWYELVELKSLMIYKLAKALEKPGRGGWWQDDCSVELLEQLLQEHMQKTNEGNEIDILNFVMFILYKKGDI